MESKCMAQRWFLCHPCHLPLKGQKQFLLHKLYHLQYSSQAAPISCSTLIPPSVEEPSEHERSESSSLENDAFLHTNSSPDSSSLSKHCSNPITDLQLPSIAKLGPQKLISSTRRKRSKILYKPKGSEQISVAIPIKVEPQVSNLEITNAQSPPPRPKQESSKEIPYNSKSDESDLAYVCDICGFQCPSQASLKRHRLLHVSKTVNKCAYCDFSGESRHKLYYHMRVHKGERKHECIVCGKQFPFSGSLINHMRTHTGERPFHCTYCDKRFPYQAGYNDHIRIHTGEKPFKCDICGKGFTQQGGLKDHIQFHTGEVNITCPVCSKGFARQKQLTEHMRKHTGERPYKCDLCDESYPYYSNLRTHKIRYHEKEQPFKCILCTSGFPDERYLVLHMRMHTGEKPFKCEYCGLVFSGRQNMETHAAIHTGKNLVTCSTCGRILANAASLKKHLERSVCKEQIRRTKKKLEKTKAAKKIPKRIGKCLSSVVDALGSLGETFASG